MELSRELVPPPRDAPGICWRCRTWSDRAEVDTCSNCIEIKEVLGRPAIPLSVITLYRKPSFLRDWLTLYKDPDAVPSMGLREPQLRSLDHIEQLAAQFVGHQLLRLQHLLDGFEETVVVPSTRRQAPHPLEQVLVRVGFGPITRPLTRTDQPLGFRRPAREGYACAPLARPGKRLLLVDDVYTTGARLNSAAIALTAGGYDVAGVLVLARRINTEYDDRAQQLWDRQSDLDFDWDISPYLTGRK